MIQKARFLIRRSIALSIAIYTLSIHVCSAQTFVWDNSLPVYQDDATGLVFLYDLHSTKQAIICPWAASSTDASMLNMVKINLWNYAHDVYSFGSELRNNGLYHPYPADLLDKSALIQDGTLVIPSTVSVDGQSLNVVGLAAGTIGSIYSTWEGISFTKVSLPEGLRIIGANQIFTPRHDEVSYANVPLSEINIPGTVTTIHDYAFYTNSRYGSETLSNVDALRTVSFEPVADATSRMTIGCNAFAQHSITDLGEFDKSAVRSIDYNAFLSAKPVSLKFPSTLESIGSRAFYYSNPSALDFSACRSLTSISLEAFARASILSALDLSQSPLVTIGDRAFQNAPIRDLDMRWVYPQIGEETFASYCGIVNWASTYDASDLTRTRYKSNSFGTPGSLKPFLVDNNSGLIYRTDTYIDPSSGNIATGAIITYNPNITTSMVHYGSNTDYDDVDMTGVDITVPAQVQATDGTVFKVIALDEGTFLNCKARSIAFDEDIDFENFTFGNKSLAVDASKCHVILPSDIDDVPWNAFTFSYQNAPVQMRVNVSDPATTQVSHYYFVDHLWYRDATDTEKTELAAYGVNGESLVLTHSPYESNTTPHYTFDNITRLGLPHSVNARAELTNNGIRFDKTFTIGSVYGNLVREYALMIKPEISYLDNTGASVTARVAKIDDYALYGHGFWTINMGGGANVNEEIAHGHAVEGPVAVGSYAFAKAPNYMGDIFMSNTYNYINNLYHQSHAIAPTVRTIGDHAFADCPNMWRFFCGDSTEVYDATWTAGSPVKMIVIGSSIKTCKDNGLVPASEYVAFRSPTPPTDLRFAAVPQQAYLHYSYLEDYRNAYSLWENTRPDVWHCTNIKFDSKTLLFATTEAGMGDISYRRFTSLPAEANDRQFNHDGAATTGVNPPATSPIYIGWLRDGMVNPALRDWVQSDIRISAGGDRNIFGDEVGRGTNGHHFEVDLYAPYAIGSSKVRITIDDECSTWGELEVEVVEGRSAEAIQFEEDHMLVSPGDTAVVRVRAIDSNGNPPTHPELMITLTGYTEGSIDDIEISEVPDAEGWYTVTFIVPDEENVPEGVLTVNAHTMDPTLAVQPSGFCQIIPGIAPDTIEINLYDGDNPHPTTDETVLTGHIGDKFMLGATVSGPDDCNKDFTWVSGDNKIADVDAHGIVTLTGAGSTIISAISKIGGVVASVRVSTVAYARAIGIYSCENGAGSSPIYSIARDIRNHPWINLFAMPDNAASLHGVTWTWTVTKDGEEILDTEEYITVEVSDEDPTTAQYPNQIGVRLLRDCVIKLRATAQTDSYNEDEPVYAEFVITARPVYTTFVGLDDHKEIQNPLKAAYHDRQDIIYCFSLPVSLYAATDPDGTYNSITFRSANTNIVTCTPAVLSSVQNGLYIYETKLYGQSMGLHPGTGLGSTLVYAMADDHLSDLGDLDQINWADSAAVEQMLSTAAIPYAVYRVHVQKPVDRIGFRSGVRAATVDDAELEEEGEFAPEILDPNSQEVPEGSRELIWTISDATDEDDPMAATLLTASNPTVSTPATIDPSTGRLTILGKGNAIVRATAVHYSPETPTAPTASYRLEVKQPVRSLILQILDEQDRLLHTIDGTEEQPLALEYPVGTVLHLKALIAPDDADDKSIEWILTGDGTLDGDRTGTTIVYHVSETPFETASIQLLSNDASVDRSERLSRTFTVQSAGREVTQMKVLIDGVEYNDGDKITFAGTEGVMASTKKVELVFNTDATDKTANFVINNGTAFRWADEGTELNSNVLQVVAVGQGSVTISACDKYAAVPDNRPSITLDVEVEPVKAGQLLFSVPALGAIPDNVVAAENIYQGGIQSAPDELPVIVAGQLLPLAGKPMPLFVMNDQMYHYEIEHPDSDSKDYYDAASETIARNADGSPVATDYTWTLISGTMPEDASFAPWEIRNWVGSMDADPDDPSSWEYTGEYDYSRMILTPGSTEFSTTWRCTAVFHHAGGYDETLTRDIVVEVSNRHNLNAITMNGNTDNTQLEFTIDHGDWVYVPAYSTNTEGEEPTVRHVFYGDTNGTYVGKVTSWLTNITGLRGTDENPLHKQYYKSMFDDTTPGLIYGHTPGISNGTHIYSLGNMVITGENLPVSRSVRFTVRPIMITKVKIDAPKTDFVVGDASTTLTYYTETTKNRPADYDQLTWSTSDRSVIAINDQGLIVPIRPGTATITLKAQDGDNTSYPFNGGKADFRALKGASDQVTITVRPVKIEQIVLSAVQDRLVIGDAAPEIQLVNTGDASAVSALYINDNNILTVDIKTTKGRTPTYGSNLNWESSNPEVIRIVNVEGSDTPRLEIISTGSAVISVTAPDYKTSDGAAVRGSLKLTVDPVRVATIGLTADKTTMLIGDSAPILSVNPLGKEGREPVNKTIRWASSDEKVMSVDANGILTAKAPGCVTITASAADPATDDVSESLDICVSPVLVERIELLSPVSTLVVGDRTPALTATLTGQKGYAPTNRDIEWSTDNGKVLAVNSVTGTLAIRGIGTASITARPVHALDDNVKASVTINVIAVPVVAVSMQDASANGHSIYRGETSKAPALNIKGYDNRIPANSALRWLSMNDKVVTVNPETGQLTGIATGQAIVRATTTDGSNISIDIPVRVLVRASTIRLSNMAVSGYPGGSFRLQAILGPEDVSDKSVTWISSAPAVASVDADGLITFNKKGSAVITARTNDGSFLTAYANVTVTKQEATVSSIVHGMFDLERAANRFFTVVLSRPTTIVVNRLYTESLEAGEHTLYLVEHTVDPVSSKAAQNISRLSARTGAMLMSARTDYRDLLIEAEDPEAVTAIDLSGIGAMDLAISSLLGSLRSIDISGNHLSFESELSVPDAIRQYVSGGDRQSVYIEDIDIKGLSVDLRTLGAKPYIAGWYTSDDNTDVDYAKKGSIFRIDDRWNGRSVYAVVTIADRLLRLRTRDLMLTSSPDQIEIPAEEDEVANGEYESLNQSHTTDLNNPTFNGSSDGNSRGDGRPHWYDTNGIEIYHPIDGHIYIYVDEKGNVSKQLFRK